MERLKEIIPDLVENEEIVSKIHKFIQNDNGKYVSFKNRSKLDNLVLFILH